jgi:hypothetical protein
MVGGATVGAIAAISVAEIGRATGAHDAQSAVLAFSLALLPAIGLHLALGLPRGELVHPVRRGIVIAGYVSAIPLGFSLYSQRPTYRCAARGRGRCRGADRVDRVRPAVQRRAPEQERPFAVDRVGRRVAAVISAGPRR